MSNKDNAWRLEDENGNKMGPKPFTSFKGADIIATFNGQVIGTLQSLDASYYNEIRELGSPQPVRYMQPGVEVNIMDEGVSFTNGPSERIGIRRETIEQEIPEIVDAMRYECHRYESMFGQRPQYISLNQAAYRSFFVEARGWHSRGMNEDTFMMIDIICNPLQEQPYLVLGSARDEAIRGGLYRE